MSKEDAQVIVCGLLHDGINADKLTSKARHEIRSALERILALTVPE
jgi:hypothetical protein